MSLLRVDYVQTGKASTKSQRRRRMRVNNRGNVTAGAGAEIPLVPMSQPGMTRTQARAFVEALRVGDTFDMTFFRRWRKRWIKFDAVCKVVKDHRLDERSIQWIDLETTGISTYGTKFALWFNADAYPYLIPYDTETVFSIPGRLKLENKNLRY